jgi:hypothetical protein
VSEVNPNVPAPNVGVRRFTPHPNLHENHFATVSDYLWALLTFTRSIAARMSARIFSRSSGNTFAVCALRARRRRLRARRSRRRSVRARQRSVSARVYSGQMLSPDPPSPSLIPAGVRELPAHPLDGADFALRSPCSA